MKGHVVKQGSSCKIEAIVTIIGGNMKIGYWKVKRDPTTIFET